MMLRKWEDLPREMQNEAVRPYYDALIKKRTGLFFKRIFDVFLSAILLLILSPIFLILALAIKLESKGTVFFRQERITQYKKTFRIYKFRTMVSGADKMGSPLTRKNDDRITKVGRVIRKTRLDEIGQLIDVLRGTMTFVGARPEIPKYVLKYTPEMLATLLLPAGVTSMASIRFKDEDRLLEREGDVDTAYIEKILPEKMHYNLNAIMEWSLWQDVKVMILTVLAVF